MSGPATCMWQELATGTERAITRDCGKDAILNGMAEFVAQEEMDPQYRLLVVTRQQIHRLCPCR